MSLIEAALIDCAHESLLARAKAVLSARLGPALEKTFSLNEIRHEVAKYGISEWLSDVVWPYPKAQPALYVIRAGDVETATNLLSELPVAKARNFGCAKVNKNAIGSSVLYVGSSESVIARLREHLWEASPSTYAMHLRRWCKLTEGEVNVSVWPILDCNDRVVRQDLEDTLWRSLSPRLGKSGGK